MMRTFNLVRYEDATGISGIGSVAEGVQFSDGTCVLNWTTAHRSTAVYRDLETLIAIHGHEGRTRVEWTRVTLADLPVITEDVDIDAEPCL